MPVDAWLAEQRESAVAESMRVLAQCREILNQEVKIPLNVACSDVFKGLFTRSGTQFSARGTAWKSVDFRAPMGGRNSSSSSSGSSMQQIETLDSALQLSMYNLERGSLSDAVAVLDHAEHTCEVPPHAVRFPAQRIELGVLGICGEAFVCERKNIVFDVHAYQDTAPGHFKATDTLSSKEVDPALQEVWGLLDTVRVRLRAAAAALAG